MPELIVLLKVKVARALDPEFEQLTDDTNVLVEQDIELGTVTSGGNVNYILSPLTIGTLGVTTIL